MTAGPTFACPCCGYRTLTEAYGCYEICPICFWEDDPVQLGDPSNRGGANGPSLIECQRSYEALGVSDARLLAHVRPATSSDVRDTAWRPVDVSKDILGGTPPGPLAPYWMNR